MAPRVSHLRPAGSASGRRRCASDQPLEPLAIPLGAHHSRLQDIQGRIKALHHARAECDMVEGAESATGHSLKALRSVPPVTHRALPPVVVGPTAAIIHLYRAKLSSPLHQLSRWHLRVRRAPRLQQPRPKPLTATRLTGSCTYSTNSHLTGSCQGHARRRSQGGQTARSLVELPARSRGCRGRVLLRWAWCALLVSSEQGGC